MEKKTIIILAIVLGLIIFIIFFIKAIMFSIIGGYINSNCGTSSYKFDVKIESKEDFLNFLQNDKYTQQMGWQYSLDNFKDINRTMKPDEIESAEINWEKVKDSIEVKEKTNWWIFKEKEYIITYKPQFCGEHTLTMSPSGKARLDGCCGI